MAVIRNMATDSDAAGCMNLRLLINQKTGKILYAEAGKDFVDLLFSFLTLPTGSVIKLLSQLNRSEKRVGCLTNLYSSVEKLQNTFMDTDKSHLLDPKLMSTLPNGILRIQSAPTVYYVCGSQTNRGGCYELSPPTNCGGRTHYMTTQSGGRCPCGKDMSYPVQLQNPSAGNSNVDIAGSSGGGGGYVKETVTFIITNELDISSASTITSINLLNKLNVTDLSNLGERNVNVGLKEALELLHASLISTTALDNVFAVRQKKPEEQEEQDFSGKKPDG